MVSVVQNGAVIAQGETQPGVQAQTAVKGVEGLVMVLHVKRNFITDALHLTFKERVFLVHNDQVYIRAAADQGVFGQDGTGKIHSDNVVRRARFLRDVLPGKLDQ